MVSKKNAWWYGMIKELCDVMEKCYERGWITTRDGNSSFRRKGSKYMYITPSGTRKNVIRVEDIIKITLYENGFDLPKGSKPSGELEMHYLLQKDSKKTQSILHAHPTHAIAAMYAGWDLSDIASQFPELNRYTKVARNVPVLPVISKELADSTFSKMTDDKGDLVFDIVGQDRHGVCAVARDPWSAYEHIERLDHICEIVLKSGVRPGESIR